MTASKLDLNGKELVLDADGDTSITSDTDDEIDFYLLQTHPIHPYQEQMPMELRLHLQMVRMLMCI